jgi:hypothetical protein
MALHAFDSLNNLLVKHYKYDVVEEEITDLAKYEHLGDRYLNFRLSVKLSEMYTGKETCVLIGDVLSNKNYQEFLDKKFNYVSPRAGDHLEICVWIMYLNDHIDIIDEVASDIIASSNLTRSSQHIDNIWSKIKPSPIALDFANPKGQVLELIASGVKLDIQEDIIAVSGEGTHVPKFEATLVFHYKTTKCTTRAVALTKKTASQAAYKQLLEYVSNKLNCS